jgi:hypothetical protein
MLVEVGPNGADWWKKFHQGVQYITIKHKRDAQSRLTQPLLLVNTMLLSSLESFYVRGRLTMITMTSFVYPFCGTASGI